MHRHGIKTNRPGQIRTDRTEPSTLPLLPIAPSLNGTEPLWPTRRSPNQQIQVITSVNAEYSTSIAMDSSLEELMIVAAVLGEEEQRKKHGSQKHKYWMLEIFKRRNEKATENFTICFTSC